MLLGITTLVKPHPQNAPSPMLVTLMGIVTLGRTAQLQNASVPMLVTLLPRVTLVRL